MTEKTKKFYKTNMDMLTGKLQSVCNDEIEKEELIRLTFASIRCLVDICEELALEQAD